MANLTPASGPGSTIPPDPTATSIPPPLQPPKTHAGQIPSLDGLRAIFFAMVFVSHCTPFPGSFGVTGFFFLSGFLITTLLRMEGDKTGGIALKDFYIRRSLRILPSLYLCIALAVGLSAAGLLGDSHASFNGTLAQCLHLTNYYKIAYGTDGTAVGTNVLWSLAVEEHFYLLFPIAYIAMRAFLPHRNAQASMLYGACLAIMAWRLYLVCGLGVTQSRTYMGSDTRFDSLLFGCALALAGNPYLDRTRIHEAIWKFILLPLGCFAILFTFLFHRGGGQQPDAPAEWFREVARYSIQGLALIPIFVCAIRYSDWTVFKLLNLRPVMYIGVLSYSLYLVHVIILRLIGDGLGIAGVAGEALAIVAILLSALAIREGIEKPLIAWRKRFRSRAAPVGRQAQEGPVEAPIAF